MQKIKVVRKESKSTSSGGMVYALFDEKNIRFSGFLSELQEVKEGDTVEADIEVQGKYNNIKSVKILEHGVASAKNDAGDNGKPANQPTPAFELAPSNRRNNALTAALTLIATGKLQAASLNELLALANKIDHWMETGKHEAPIQPKG